MCAKSIPMSPKARHRRQSKELVSFQGSRDIETREVRDVDGHYVGYLLDKPHGQATMLCQVDADSTEAVTGPALAEWEQSLVGIDQLVAVVSTISIEGARSSWSLSATFVAADRTERKDHTELTTRLATVAPRVYRQASAAGFKTTPLTSEQVQAFGRYHWSPEAVGPEAEALVEENSREVLIDGTRHISYEVSCDDGTEILDRLTLIAREFAGLSDQTLRIARVFRPADNTDDQSPGRWVGLFVVSSPMADGNVAATIAGLCFAELTPRERLRIRRLLGRQQIGLAMALGLSVLGWQHLEVVA